MIGGDNAAEQLKDVAHGVEHLHSTLGGAAGRFTQRRVGQVQQLLYAQAVEDTQGNTTVTPTVWPGKTKCHGCVAVVTQGNAHVCVCVCVCVCECVCVHVSACANKEQSGRGGKKEKKGGGGGEEEIFTSSQKDWVELYGCIK